MSLSVGQVAPDFTLPSTSGGNFSLSHDAAGQPLILYFYPKDFTPGCTQEACDFRDMFAEFRDLDIGVLGISRDDIPTHLRFQQEHRLPFQLLSDVDGKVSAQYQALVPIIRVNKRVTYLLDQNHRIAAVYEDFFGAHNHIKAMVTQVKSGKLAPGKPGDSRISSGRSRPFPKEVSE